MYWTEVLKSSITDLHSLCRTLNLSLCDVSLDAEPSFPLRVPQPFIDRMVPGDPNDPLLLQVLPLSAERIETPGYHLDPLQEGEFTPVPGLLHKYAGRVLVTLTGSCAVNCRYCFRRHFPYADNAGLQHWSDILNYIQHDGTIEEVILSGGDPLLVDDRRFAGLVTDLEKNSHLTTLRIHTRLPVVIPSRITPEFVALLSETRLRCVVVLHSNHPNEIDTVLTDALARLQQPSITLLNQSVFLKGVNDSPEVLASLSRRLFSAGVLPYYLHALDRVAGAAHFNVPETQMLEIHRSLQSRLPGYLVPKLVREVPAAKNKIQL